MILVLTFFTVFIDFRLIISLLRHMPNFSDEYYLFYRGLVLQDLTFVHIGNSNLLPSGLINFSKRWQQYNIVENMKRFKKWYVTF